MTGWLPDATGDVLVAKRLILDGQWEKALKVIDRLKGADAYSWYELQQGALAMRPDGHKNYFHRLSWARRFLEIGAPKPALMCVALYWQLHQGVDTFDEYAKLIELQAQAMLATETDARTR